MSTIFDAPLSGARWLGQRMPAGALVRMSTCAACGSRQANRYRFCPHCGAPVALHWPGENALARPPMRSTRQPASERKQVTVMFVDLCGSTSRVAGVDPEEAREYLDGALRLMSAAVESYGGTISRLMGDGLLALFGAPSAQEDHALRACLAALAIQQRTREPSATEDRREPLHMRIGVDSGEALVGVASEYGWSYYRADGPCVHLASRLEQMARPGSVLVSGNTFRLVSARMEATSLGLRDVRGFDAPVTLYELTPASRESATAPLASQRRWAPMVGRTAVLNGLEMVGRQVRAGAMHVLGVRGEAGIGKSRLIAEFCAGSGVEGFGICHVRASAHLSSSPYSAAAELARELVRLPRELGRHARRHFLQPLLDHWGALAPRHLPVLDDLLDLERSTEDWLLLGAAQRRRRIAETLHALIVRRVDDGPLALVVEDIFLIDADSQRVLEALIPKLEGRPVLVCVSYRPDFRHRWSEASWFIEQWIGPLQSDEMVRMARALLGPHDSLAGVVDELVARADGNPFFLEQLAITLIDDGSLVGPPGSYRLVRTQADVRVPASISAMIGARVDRLPLATKSALEAAAVLDAPITIDSIAAMLETSAAEAHAHLTHGAAAGLLTTPDGPATPHHGFRHALVQEVLAASLTRSRRKALHRGAFGVLSARAGSQAADESTAIVQHAHAGELWADAAEWAVKAMSRAIARSASREALRLFGIGMDSAARVESPAERPPLELSLLLEVIGARMPLGQIDEIVADVERAGVLAERLGDERRMATVSLQLAVFLWMRGKYTQGLVYAAQARDAGVRTGRRTLQMAALQARIMMNHGLGRYREAMEDALTVRQVFAAELCDRRMLAGWATLPLVNLLSFLASSQWRLGLLEQAQETCESAYRELSMLDHWYSRGLVDFVQGQIWVEQGRHVEAARLLRASTRMCELNDVPTLYPCVVSMLGGALARNGQAAEAAALLGKALDERAHLYGGTYGELFLRHNLGVALARAGQLDRALEMAESAVEFAAAGEQHGHKAEALFELGEALANAGRLPAACRRFEEARTQAVACGMPYFVQRASERLLQSRTGLWPTPPGVH